MPAAGMTSRAMAPKVAPTCGGKAFGNARLERLPGGGSIEVAHCHQWRSSPRDESVGAARRAIVLAAPRLSHRATSTSHAGRVSSTNVTPISASAQVKLLRRSLSSLGFPFVSSSGDSSSSAGFGTACLRDSPRRPRPRQIDGQAAPWPGAQVRISRQLWFSDLHRLQEKQLLARIHRNSGP